MDWLKVLRVLSKKARGQRRRRRPAIDAPQTPRCLPIGILRSARCSYPPAAPLLRRRIA
jgi:hypothetical protein